MIPMQLIEQLVARLPVKSDDPNLGEYIEQLSSQTSDNPARLLEQMLSHLQLSSYTVSNRSGSTRAQAWQFALLCAEDEWYLADHSEKNLERIYDSSGQLSELEADKLDAADWYLLTAKTNISFGRIGRSPAEKLVLQELFSQRRWLRDILIASLIINLLAISTSLFAMQVYDRVVPTLAYATLTTLVAGMAIVVSLDWLLKVFRARTLDGMSCEVDRRVSQRVFDHLLSLRLDARPRMLGTLAAQVSGLDSIRQFFSSTVVFGLIDLPFVILFVVFIAIIGGPVAWVYIILLPLAIILGTVTQMRLRNLMRQQMIRANERQGLLVDAIRGTETLRASHADWRFKNEWRDVTQSISRFNIQQRAISSLATVSTASLSTLAYVSALVVGVTQIEAGNLTMGALIACSILGGRVIAPVSQAVQYLSQWQNVRQSLEMLNHLLSLDTERVPQQTLLQPDQDANLLSLDSVRFSYPESDKSQIDIDQLSFQPGDRVLLLGRVGSGKSTLLKILAGSYRPAAGRVKLGGVDMWELDPSYIAQQIGYLPQQTHLFKGSLKENLLLGGQVKDDRFVEVCSSLSIDQIAAASPKGFDRPISEGGEGLSGGQRQMVALARVLMEQPNMLLLDEPTAAFDQDTDRQALRVINQSMREEGILVLSTHRLGLAAKIVNRVVWLEQGCVKADGPPDQILPQFRQSRAAASKADSKNEPEVKSQAESTVPAAMKIPSAFKADSAASEPASGKSPSLLGELSDDT